jgi:hypothetical protein
MPLTQLTIADTARHVAVFTSTGAITDIAPRAGARRLPRQSVDPRGQHRRLLHDHGYGLQLRKPYPSTRRSGCSRVSDLITCANNLVGGYGLMTTNNRGPARWQLLR